MKNLIISSMLFITLCFAQQEKLPEGFVYLSEYLTHVEIDLRYFSKDNFVGDTVNSYHSNKCIISIEAAKALKKVNEELNAKGIGLKVFDAYRPQGAVNHFVRWAKDMGDTLTKSKYYPNENKKYLFKRGYIASKSGHSRGSTIDLTLIDLETKVELDMGSGWDFFGKISWPMSGKVTAEQKENRMLLRNTMIKHGFKPYEKEWWHFTLKDEPYPDTYFDFPVK